MTPPSTSGFEALRKRLAESRSVSDVLNSSNLAEFNSPAKKQKFEDENDMFERKSQMSKPSPGGWNPKVMDYSQRSSQGRSGSVISESQSNDDEMFNRRDRSEIGSTYGG